MSDYGPLPTEPSTPLGSPFSRAIIIVGGLAYAALLLLLVYVASPWYGAWHGAAGAGAPTAAIVLAAALSAAFGASLLVWSVVVPASPPFRLCLVLIGLLLTVAPAAFVLAAPPPATKRTAVIFAVNDTYRIEPNRHDNLGGFARLRALRAQYEASGEEVLLLHAGDFLSPSLLTKVFHGEQMVAALNLMDGDAGAADERMLVVFGNHEFDESHCGKPQILQDRIRQSEFPWLAANIDFKDCPGGTPMLPPDLLAKIQPTAIVRIGGIRIGVFGLSIEASLSSGKQPPKIGDRATRLALARSLSRQLREAGAEIVVALTHLEREEDEAILNAFTARLEDGRVADGPDFVIGGHDHERMIVPTANGRAIYKADADAKTVSVLRLTLDADRRLDVAHRFVHLGPGMAEDGRMKQAVDDWLAEFDRRYEARECKGTKGCLEDGKAATPETLFGDERRVRGTVTTLGTWITHEMLAAAGTCFSAGAGPPAEIAIINSGALRLNGDIRAGSRLTRRDVEEIFYYPALLKIVDIRGDLLRDTLRHSFERRDSGGWLQIAGLKIRKSGAEPAVVEADGRAIDPAKTYRMVVNTFLLDPQNYDRFDLSGTAAAPCPNGPADGIDLKAWLVARIAGQASIVVPPVAGVCEEPGCGGVPGRFN